jgi:hypothetical protein
MNKKMPKSMRKFVRTEKARIRRVVLNVGEQDKQINDLYAKLAAKPVVVEAVSTEPKRSIKKPKAKKAKK